MPIWNPFKKKECPSLREVRSSRTGELAWQSDFYDPHRTSRSILTGPKTGKIIARIETDKPPEKVALGWDNNIYLFDQKTITSISKSGNIISTIEHDIYGRPQNPPAGGGINGIAIGSDHTFFVAARGIFTAIGSRCSKLWSFDAQEISNDFRAPVIDIEGDVYTTEDWGTLYCLSSEGQCKWKFQKDRGHPRTSPPSMDDKNNIYFSTAKHLYCVNNLGQLVFEVETANRIITAPVVDIRLQRIYYVTDLYAAHIFCINCIDMSGQLIWETEIKPGSNVINNIALNQDGALIFASDLNHEPTIMKLEPNGNILWHTYVGSNRTPSCPTVDIDGNLFIVITGSHNTELIILDSTYDSTQRSAVLKLPEKTDQATIQACQPLILRPGLMALWVPTYSGSGNEYLLRGVLYLIE